jgi:hypothetical protein
VFLRGLTRHGQDVPLAPGTRVYVGDVATLVGLTEDLNRVVPMIGQPIRLRDRTDIAFLTIGFALGLLVGLLGITVGSVPLTLGGGGGALVAGLVCGWLRARRPTMGAFPPAAQQTVSDLGLGGFVAAIGMAGRAGRPSGNSSEWADVARCGNRRHADPHGGRNAVRASRVAHESGCHLRVACRRHDGRRRGKRRVRRCREPDPGARRRCALCHRQRRPDCAWTDHRGAHLCQMSEPTGVNLARYHAPTAPDLVNNRAVQPKQVKP